MSSHNGDGAGTPGSDDWIEMQRVVPPFGGVRPEGTRNTSPESDPASRTPLPNLRVDTSQLNLLEDEEAGSPNNTPPQSAILGLAQGSNMVIDNWLPDKKEGSSPVGQTSTSPEKILKTPRRRSQHHRPSFTRSASSASASHVTSSPLSASPSPYSALKDRFAAGKPKNPEEPESLRNRNYKKLKLPIPQLTLTVERSFERNTGEDTPLDAYDSDRTEYLKPGGHNPFVHESAIVDDDDDDRSSRHSYHGSDYDEVADDDDSSSITTHLSPLRQRNRSRLYVKKRPRRSSRHGSGSSASSHLEPPNNASSPNRQPQQAQQSLSLSGAAYAAQQDLLDAEEEGRSIVNLDAGSTDDRSSMRRGSNSSAYRSDDGTDTNSETQSFIDTLASEPLGRTLFYFDSSSAFRRAMFKVVSSDASRYIDIILTIVQVGLLCYEVWGPFTLFDGLPNVLNGRIQYSYAGLYAVFTLSALANCIAYGVFTNEIVTGAEVKAFCMAALRRGLYIITLGSVKPAMHRKPHSSHMTRYNCFLRKSWGRVEFLSICFFWSMMGVTTRERINSLELIVAGLGHLRILKLLDEITLTRVVLQVLKTAIPFLMNVLIFIGFFLAIWGVTGLQSFNGSLRRVCIYNEIVTKQKCGSWLNPDTKEKMPYLLLDSARGTYQNQSTIKGYTCPVGSICVELRAFPPFGSFSSMANQSFDNIFNALELVLIMMSNNGFTEIMYDVIDSEYLASSLFFITGVLILGIWLMNLLVAVMVSSYVSVRHKFDETINDSTIAQLSRIIYKSTLGKLLKPREHAVPQRSVDRRRIDVNGVSQASPISEKDVEDQPNSFNKHRDRGNWIIENTTWGRRYSMICPLFAILAVIDLIVQASKTSPNDGLFVWELVLAIVYGVEILFRFWVFIPYWRYFFFSFTNLVDLALAVANCVILAFYEDDELYAWLTIFQLLRVYRMVGALKYSRVFWLQVFGNFKALVSLTGFFFLCTFFSTLIATKMLRGQFPMKSDDDINEASFYDLSVGFFSMYQVASTENWTDVLFWVTDNVSRPGDSVVGLACMGILFCGWLFFANFLIFNLFVGIMSESLHGAISNKREEQVRQFFEEVKEANLAQHGASIGGVFWGFSLNDDDEEDKEDEKSNSSSRPVMFRDKIVGILMRWLTRSRRDPLVVSKTIREAIERQFVVEFLEAHGSSEPAQEGKKIAAGKTFMSLDIDNENINGFKPYADLPFVQKLERAFYRVLSYFHHYPQDYRGYLIEKLEAQSNGDQSRAAYVDGMFDQRANTMAILKEYCQEHPTFDRPLFIFGPENKLRLLCQKIVTSSRGARLSNVYPKKWVVFYVRLFFLLATTSLVVQTCVYTPLKSSEYTTDELTYYRILDLVYGVIFTIEFLVKVIADGFHFTPNAYTWSIWNCIDLTVLISIWMTFINDLVNGGLSRYLRAFMALRALRIISFFHQSELLLSAVFKYGLRNILGAFLIMLSIVVPYSVWGKNIFHDRLRKCNDESVDLLSDCTGEFLSTVFDDFKVLMPRVIEENYFNYNNFWEALLIQFGVLSLEGWVDVLQAVTAITGKDKQPETYSSNGNAAYPILYHYIGAVLIMTMLIAVIIRNYSLTMGTAFLTEQQLSWLDVKRTLQLLNPTPKPPQYRQGSVRLKLLTIIPTWITSIELWTLFVATVDMAAYFYPVTVDTKTVYELILVACSLLLVVLNILRLIVLQPTLYFHNWWNPFGLIVCLSVTVLTTVRIVFPDYRATGAVVVDRIADILMLLLWIPRTKKLYQFYLISTAAISEISVLLRAWFTLFVTYAIALNQSFGLTKLGPESTWSRNFRTIPKALIALFTMSCGEGWNQLLVDYTISKPYCLEDSKRSECGIPGFAYFLFITWNLVSMYVFANIFISLICEACWYVYRSGPVNIRERDIVTLLDSWQQFDPRGTGYIRTKDLFKFLGKTQGYFSLSIYNDDPKYHVHKILAATQADMRTVVDPYSVDMDAINKYLEKMPVHKYRDKRHIYELFTTQAQLGSYAIPGGRGIRFSKLTLLFPLYQDMNPAETLTLKEFMVLRVQLHEARLTLAANFIIRRWRNRRKYFADSKSETPGFGYDQSFSESKPGNSVYWVT